MHLPRRQAVPVALALLALFRLPGPAVAGPRVLNFMTLAGVPNHHPEARSLSRIVLDSLARARQWTMVHSEDPALFTDTGLARFDAILFNNTGGNVFDAPRKQALEAFIRKGGGVAGIHAATFMHKVPGEWPWWENLIGKLHLSGPPERGMVGTGANTITLRDTSRRFTEGLPRQWLMPEVEWYHYNRDLPATIHVLATADAARDMAGYPAWYPVSWCHHYDGGRAWYTNMGHFASEFEDARFIRHLLTGIEWAAEKQAAGCGDGGKPVALPVPPRGGGRRLQAGISGLEPMGLYDALGARLPEGVPGRLPTMIRLGGSP